ncbi:uncharacterized protein K02A2.6 [Trichonephila clavipes]|nr:uncharacterized protein K02A2.6 [Trichonephila clavipes]
MKGIKPDPKKFRAIEEFATPNCKEYLQRFLGVNGCDIWVGAHFNYYTYGRIVTVQTDHKPILGLSKKPYDTISPRLQGKVFRLNKYNIQLEYVPGKNLVIADTLSRAQFTTDNFDEVLVQEATVRINLLTQVLPTKWEEIASLRAGDPEMQDVLFYTNNGWPQKKKTKIAAQPYWNCKEELYSTKEGIICRGQ